MNETKVHQKNMNVKYVYDYPANREVSKHLDPRDKQLIAAKTGFSLQYIQYWCRGKRRSRRIDDLARQIMRLNIAKQHKLDSQPNL
jgi:hypothetical protein